MARQADLAHRPGVTGPAAEAPSLASALVPDALARRTRLLRPVCDLAALAGCLALVTGSNTALATLVIALGIGVGSLIAPARMLVLIRATAVTAVVAVFAVRAHRAGSLDVQTTTQLLLVIMVAVLCALLAEHGTNPPGQLFGLGFSFRGRGFQETAEFQRSLSKLRGKRFAVIAVGIDGLELIGRLWGPTVAAAVAGRVEDELRGWAGGRTPMARVKADEYAVVLLDATPAMVRAAAERLSGAIAGGPADAVHPSVSAGWATGGDSFAEDGRPQAVWAAAREALSQAHDLGGGSIVAAGDRRYAAAGGTPAMMRRVVATHPLDAGDEPIVELSSGRVIAAEALARPSSMPADDRVGDLFAVAREIGALSELENACRRAALDGSEVFPDSLPLHLNVSVAAVATSPVDDAAELAEVIRAAGRDPHTVVLDLTDAARFDFARISEVAGAYREHGFGVGIDGVPDAAWGLELLSAVVPDVLKLDRSTLGRTVINAGAREDVRRLVVRAQALGVLVVAKAIETDDMAGRVAALGITAGQGRPLSVDGLVTARAESMPIAG